MKWFGNWSGLLRGSGKLPRLFAYLRLGRIAELPPVWTHALAGVALCGATVSDELVAVLAGAFSLLYVGGMFLHDAFDKDVDARERPDRPIPSGLISVGEALAVGFMLLLGGVRVIAGHAPHPWAGGIGGGIVALGLFMYAALHHGTPLGPIMKAGCRVLMYVTASLAVRGSVPLDVWIGGAALLAHLLATSVVGALRRPVRPWPLLLLIIPVGVGVYFSLQEWLAAGPLLVYVGSLLASLWMLRMRGQSAIPVVVPLMASSTCLLDSLFVATIGKLPWMGLALAAMPVTLRLQSLFRKK